MVKLLHFADAHIDIANHGRHDPITGLPVRVNDFLKSLDTIVDTAIRERVDLVIFAGDAYRDRSPAPTFTREWEKRILRLSKARIRTLLLVGNHDISPALGRAHAIEEFATLEVPYIHVIQTLTFLQPAELDLPVQVIGVPWVSKARYLAAQENLDQMTGDEYQDMAAVCERFVDKHLREADPTLPVIMTAHASVQGATYGYERMVMLGKDLVLPGSMVKDPRLDYVALGHIHKAQNLNEDNHPPVIYPGSIERVDFGEARDDKYFVIADVERGKTEVEWRKLDDVRPFYDCRAILQSPDGIMDCLMQALPNKQRMKDAVLRLTIEFPREYEKMIDEPALREYTGQALEFHLVKKAEVNARVRLPNDKNIGSLPPSELLKMYWRSNQVAEETMEELSGLAEKVIHEAKNNTDEDEAGS